MARDTNAARAAIVTVGAVLLSAANWAQWPVQLPQLGEPGAPPPAALFFLMVALAAGVYTYYQLHARIGELKAELAGEIGKQNAMNGLAKLRHDGVQLFANAPTPTAFATWVGQVGAWRQRVSAFLDQHFEFAMVEWFEDIGPVPLVDMRHRIDTAHEHQLQMLAVDLHKLQAVIEQNTRLMKFRPAAR